MTGGAGECGCVAASGRVCGGMRGVLEVSDRLTVLRPEVGRGWGYWRSAVGLQYCGRRAGGAGDE